MIECFKLWFYKFLVITGFELLDISTVDDNACRHFVWTTTSSIWWVGSDVQSLTTFSWCPSWLFPSHEVLSASSPKPEQLWTAVFLNLSAIPRAVTVLHTDCAGKLLNWKYPGLSPSLAVMLDCRTSSSEPLCLTVLTRPPPWTIWPCQTSRMFG